MNADGDLARLFVYHRDLDERFHRHVVRHFAANRLNPEVEITGSNRKYPTAGHCVGVEIEKLSCPVFCKQRDRHRTDSSTSLVERVNGETIERKPLANDQPECRVGYTQLRRDSHARTDFLQLRSGKHAPADSDAFTPRH